MTENVGNLDWVRRLATTLKDHQIYQLSMETEDVSLTLKARVSSFQAPAPSVVDPGEQEVEEADVALIRSENVGIFRSTVMLSPGTLIKKGEKLGVVESVSLRHDLVSDRTGQLLEVLTTDGDPVEYGQPLLVLSSEERDTSV